MQTIRLKPYRPADDTMGIRWLAVKRIAGVNRLLAAPQHYRMKLSPDAARKPAPGEVVFVFEDWRGYPASAQRTRELLATIESVQGAEISLRATHLLTFAPTAANDHYLPLCVQM